jgi:hypothetical protein
MRNIEEIERSSSKFSTFEYYLNIRYRGVTEIFTHRVREMVMAISDEFKREFYAGNYAEALKIALTEAIELKITTCVVTDDLQGIDPTRSQPAGDRMYSRINIVDGDIENEIGSNFLSGQPYSELRDFHLGQVQEGRNIINRNLQNLQTMFSTLTAVLTGRIAEEAEFVEEIEPEALPAPLPWNGHPPSQLAATPAVPPQEMAVPPETVINPFAQEEAGSDFAAATPNGDTAPEPFAEDLSEPFSLDEPGMEPPGEVPVNEIDAATAAADLSAFEDLSEEPSAEPAADQFEDLLEDVPADLPESPPDESWAGSREVANLVDTPDLPLPETDLEASVPAETFVAEAPELSVDAADAAGQLADLAFIPEEPDMSPDISNEPESGDVNVPIEASMTEPPLTTLEASTTETEEELSFDGFPADLPGDLTADPFALDATDTEAGTSESPMMTEEEAVAEFGDAFADFPDNLERLDSEADTSISEEGVIPDTPPDMPLDELEGFADAFAEAPPDAGSVNLEAAGEEIDLSVFEQLESPSASDTPDAIAGSEGASDANALELEDFNLDTPEATPSEMEFPPVETEDIAPAGAEDMNLPDLFAESQAIGSEEPQAEPELDDALNQLADVEAAADTTAFPEDIEILFPDDAPDQESAASLEQVEEDLAALGDLDNFTFEDVAEDRSADAGATGGLDLETAAPEQGDTPEATVGEEGETSLDDLLDLDLSALEEAAPPEESWWESIPDETPEPQTDQPPAMPQETVPDPWADMEALAPPDPGELSVEAADVQDEAADWLLDLDEPVAPETTTGSPAMTDTGELSEQAIEDLFGDVNTEASEEPPAVDFDLDLEDLLGGMDQEDASFQAADPDNPFLDLSLEDEEDQPNQG